MIAARIETIFTSSFTARAVGLLALPLLRRLQGELAPAQHNGASFVGLQGIVVKSHGSAGPEGFKSAIRRALREIEENLPQRLHGRLSEHLL
jgi:glycerol-3-phosphate acyltransferase PlsX